MDAPRLQRKQSLKTHGGRGKFGKLGSVGSSEDDDLPGLSPGGGGGGGCKGRRFSSGGGSSEDDSVAGAHCLAQRGTLRHLHRGWAVT